MKTLFSSVLFITLLNFQSQAQQTVGLFQHDDGTTDGYVLFSPLPSNNTYLIDKCGKLVHSWSSTHTPGASVYLLDDGTLLRPGSTGNTVFTAGGNGGIIEKFDWNSNVVWSFAISDNNQCQHHDICQLPNGNVIAIVWENKTITQATDAGRNPALLDTSLWSEKLVELQPLGTDSAAIVWEWHVWDHLVQDFDSTKPNYGTVSQHPELIDLNYSATANTTNSDWLHINAIAYNADLDQIMISIHNFDELWVIDHSTTTAQAALHTGGTHNKGGDLLYRWGNPRAYGRGNNSDKKLFGQHNAHWIADSLPDGGAIMVFNNGQGRTGGTNYSSVDIINPPIDSAGNYTLAANQAYGPSAAAWSYTAPNPTDFYGMNISGAQRLSNGNTVICEGPSGTFFEIDTAKNVVWKYVNPVTPLGAVSQGSQAMPNNVFRCTQYAAGYAGFNGQTLAAGDPIELNPLSYTCINSTTGINEQALATNITVVNPFHNTLQLMAQGINTVSTITLTNILGATMQTWSNIDLADGGMHTLSLSNSLPDGMYLVTIANKGGKQSVLLVRQ